MTKNERQGPRKPATKLPNLQKKMAQTAYWLSTRATSSSRR